MKYEFSFANPQEEGDGIELFVDLPDHPKLGDVYTAPPHVYKAFKVLEFQVTDVYRCIGREPDKNNTHPVHYHAMLEKQK